MKRTFLVEIEVDDDDTEVNADCIRRGLHVFDERIVVTETTAVHAKEREVIEAALEQAIANGRTSGGYDEWVNATEVTDEKARELRALMEGKA